MTNGRTDAWTDTRTEGGHFIISRPGPIGRQEIKNIKKVVISLYENVFPATDVNTF